MTICLGLDAGTTSLSVVAIDVSDGAIAASINIEHHAGVAIPGRPLCAEQDVSVLMAAAMQALNLASMQLGTRVDDVVALGITGQQHGLVLLDDTNTLVRPAIIWQDQRVAGNVPGTGQSYLDLFIQQAGGIEEFAACGCTPATGYLGPTLYWLMMHGELDPEHHACFVPDAIATWLTGKRPACDPTNGGSSGIFDVAAGDWLWPVIERLGLPQSVLPPALPPGHVLGSLRSEIAEQVGLPVGLPVTVSCGDNQASFLGSVAHPQKSLLINIGTGGQISAAIDHFERIEKLDTRAFFGDAYLLVGAGLFGGRTYALLRDFFRQVAQAFYGDQNEGELYDTMTRLAEQVPDGCDGLRCLPLFAGTRQDPALRGSFSGISVDNLTPEHFTRALLEGMADGFLSFAEMMRPVMGERPQLIGAGNGLIKNRLLAQLLANRFGLPMQIAAQSEAGATGAALVAAVGTGRLGSWRDAGQLLRYVHAIEPLGVVDRDLVRPRNGSLTP